MLRLFLLVETWLSHICRNNRTRFSLTLCLHIGVFPTRYQSPVLLTEGLTHRSVQITRIGTWYLILSDIHVICGTSRPGGGGGRPGVGLSSMLSSRCWANVGPAGVAVWAVTGDWPGAVCELFSPFEYAKYQYLCKMYHYHYYYSWQSLVKALTSLF